jgi:hypothetical protein
MRQVQAIADSVQLHRVLRQYLAQPLITRGQHQGSNLVPRELARVACQLLQELRLLVKLNRIGYFGNLPVSFV